MCEEINCGIGGNCTGGNCTCQTGFVNVENFCEETCAFGPCEELIKKGHNNNNSCVVLSIFPRGQFRELFSNVLADVNRKYQCSGMVIKPLSHHGYNNTYN